MFRSANPHRVLRQHYRLCCNGSTLICAFVCIIYYWHIPLVVAADLSDVETTSVTLTATEKQLLQSFGNWPLNMPADPGNELSGISWAEELGQTLFHDPGLSSSGAFSCATCHQNSLAFSDGAQVAMGVRPHVRNTQGLLDVGLQRWFGWDGGADSLWAATLRPMLSNIEMDGNIEHIGDYLRNNDGFSKALETAGLMEGNEQNNEAVTVLAAKAIATHLRTLQSAPTSFDVYVDAVQREDELVMATYPDAAKRGLKIFLGDANCHVCHFGPNFSNGEFHDTGRPFFTAVGQVDPGRYEGIKRVRTDRYNLLGEFNSTKIDTEVRKTQTVKIGQANFGEWRTPSLRNLTLTAPYTHDGSLKTLRAVVDAYADINPDRLHSQGESILKPLNLDNQAREDLVTFLESLTP